MFRLRLDRFLHWMFGHDEPELWDCQWQFATIFCIKVFFFRFCILYFVFVTSRNWLVRALDICLDGHNLIFDYFLQILYFVFDTSRNWSVRALDIWSDVGIVAIWLWGNDGHHSRWGRLICKVVSADGPTQCRYAKYIC